MSWIRTTSLADDYFFYFFMIQAEDKITPGHVSPKVVYPLAMILKLSFVRISTFLFFYQGIKQFFFFYLPIFVFHFEYFI